MSKKVKIAIIAALVGAGALAFAQQIYTYRCINCGRVSQSTNPIPPKCGCGNSMMQLVR